MSHFMSTILNGAMTALNTLPGAVAGLAVGGSALLAGGRKVWRGTKRVSHALYAVERIESEFKTNGGGSFRDGLNRIEGRQAVDRAMLRGIAASYSEPIFEADLDGRTCWVNDRWTKLTGMECTEALGEGWINAVHQDDRREVLAVWQEARDAIRVWLHTHRYRNVITGHVVSVTVRAEPIVNGIHGLAGWIGTVRVNHFE